MKRKDEEFELLDCDPDEKERKWCEKYKARKRGMRNVMVKAYRKHHRFEQMPTRRVQLYYGDDEGRAD